MNTIYLSINQIFIKTFIRITNIKTSLFSHKKIMHLSSSSVLNPSHQVIYLSKQRPLIFTQEYNLKHKKKNFSDIYNSPIFNELSFLISSDYQSCDCLNTIEECPKMRQILKENKRSEAKAIFEQLKLQAMNNCQQTHKHNSISIHNQVLQPHFQNLLTVINPQNVQILQQLLRHLKTDYTTFWVYGIYCTKFPSYQDLIENIAHIVTQRNLDMDVQSLLDQKERRLQIAYQSKLLSMFRCNFSTIVNLVCKSPRNDFIIEKLLICQLIRGRERKEIEVIQAAMDM